MLFFEVKDYADFCEKFGLRVTEEGAKVRSEKITLQVVKEMFRNKQGNPTLWNAFFGSHLIEQPTKQSQFGRLLNLPYDGYMHHNDLDVVGAIPSNEYEVVDRGICYDGDTSAIRYCKDGHIYKMRASKLFGKVWREHKLHEFYGERLGNYLGEKFAERWNAFAERESGGRYRLFVDDDFQAIYSVGNMSSCMAHHNQWMFYRDAVKAKAAYLRDEEDNIVCRCVIFMEAHQVSTGKTLRLAERQYAIGQSDKLKTILVGKLYAGGYIDANKRVGASCWDNNDFVDVNGHTLDDCDFEIECNLHGGDTLSFQDTFRYYNLDEGIANNYCSEDFDLATTDGTFRGGEQYDDYIEEYVNCSEDDMYWVHWRDRYGDVCDGSVCENTRDEYFVYVDNGTNSGEWWHEDDVIRDVDDYTWTYEDADRGDIVEVDGDFYESDDDRICYAEDSYQYELRDNCIYWEEDGNFYSYYTWSEKLEMDVPDCLIEGLEAQWDEEHAEDNENEDVA